MVDSRSEKVYIQLKSCFFFHDPWDNEGNNFYVPFRANSCSRFIASNLKFLGVFLLTTMILCFFQKLYVTVTFGASPSGNRVLP